MTGPESVPPARKNVGLWIAYNQRRWLFERDVLPLDERAPFVCECTSSVCHQPVEMTMQEFEAAHMCRNWLAVRPEHVIPGDAYTILLREPHFWVVELGILTERPGDPERMRNGALSTLVAGCGPWRWGKRILWLSS